MVDNLARKPNSPGAGLPEFIAERMQELGYRPSLRKLAHITEIPVMTLKHNFNDRSSMRLDTAKSISAALEITLDSFEQGLL